MSKIGLEGALMALSPALLLLPFFRETSGVPPISKLLMACLATAACWGSALTLFRHPRFGKILAVLAIAASCSIVFRHIFENPFLALASMIGLIFIIFTVVDFRIVTSTIHSDHSGRCLHRARWAALTVSVIVVISQILPVFGSGITGIVLATSSLIAQGLFLHWLLTVRSTKHYVLPVAGMATIVGMLWSSATALLPGIILALSFLNWLVMPRADASQEKEEQWWEFLLDHPARILFTTFFFLCASGTLLLILPVSTESGTIDVIDAMFTSVSAVCVTGLIVLDTPNYFSLFGQACILLLIQLGGLGIMTITTVALHAIGRRLSLKQERLMTSMTATSHRDLVHSLGTILKLTFACEGLGAAVLTSAFLLTGEPFPTALWRGIFTSISAFCNAGFALQSDNLVSYQTNALILNTVSSLIILGGIAPATSLLIPRWLAGKQVPIPAKISLVTSAALLLTGTVCILSFEWTGVLAGLSVADKIENAWFQSVTLRTAGFNSVDIAHISSSTFLIMIVFMFIGGSPGGTAGGVKTTTIGILAMTFWSNIANKNEIITQKRRIHPSTIYRAVTIVVAGFSLWFLVVLMLETTQQIPSRDLLFEVTSALGTVGLSTGATVMLDEIGKIIIIFTMFAGRIGPVTLFMLLSNEQPVSDTRYPVESIPIT